MKKKTLILWILFIFSMIAYYSYQSIADSFVIPDHHYFRAIRMDGFLDKFKEKKLDRVLIVNYTIEGGYILSELTTYDHIIKLTIDPMGDPYSTDEKQKLICRNIKRRIENFNINYILDQCDQYPADTEVVVASLYDIN